jgi:Periplasmic binding protein
MNTDRIGVLAPLSPPGWVEAGRHLLTGLELAAEEVGLDLVVRDTAADPARAAVAVDELADLGVSALVGEYHSVVARAVATRADALGLPYLCSSAVLDALTDQPSDWVARIAPAQSHGWRIYADFLLGAGHRRVAVVTQPSVYWAAGTRILRDHLDVVELPLDSVCDDLAASGATALLLLVGTPEPAKSVVRSVRRDPRLADILIGAPAGQPEFASWAAFGGIPFLRYLPARLGPLGLRVEAALCSKLGEEPSFVAFEGYDTVLALAARLRGGSWADVDVDGTRGRITFTSRPGIPVWQWAWARFRSPTGIRPTPTASASGMPTARADGPAGRTGGSTGR